MGRIYSVIFEKVAITADQHLFSLLTPATGMAVLHSVDVGQDSDPGDAEAEMGNIIIHRNTSAGSGGTAPTPAPLNLGHAASGVGARVNDTTPGTEGTILEAYTFNWAIGFQKIWTPETRIWIPPSARISITLQTDPTDSLTCNGTLVFEELD